MSEDNLQFYSKEFIRPVESPGIGKTKHPDCVYDFFVYEPKNIEEAKLGTLFMLGKIDNIPKNKYKSTDFLLNLLISVIKREFYSDFKRSGAEALEASLNKANLYLADFAEKGNTEWMGNFHFVCGVLTENTLHVTQAGDIMIKLFREGGVSHIEKKFTDSEKVPPLKTFNNIASGKIIPGDKLVLGTKNILTLASLKELKALSTKDCNRIILNFENLARAKSIKPPLVSLVLEAKPVFVTDTAPQIVKTSPEIEQKITKQKRISIGKLRPIILKIGTTFKVIFILLGKGFRLLRPVTRAIGKTAVCQRITITTRKIPQKLNEKYKIRKKYYYLKDQNKPAFIISLILILLILILPYFTVQKINYLTKLHAFNQLAEKVQAIQKKIDSALIYQQQDKARALIERNQSLLSSLIDHARQASLKNNEQVIARAFTLEEKYQNQQDSINNVIRVNQLEEVLNFSKTGFIVNPAGISKAENSLYFYELDSGILYKSDLSTEEKNSLTLIFISAKDELRKMISLNSGQIILFGQSGKAYIYNSATKEHEAYLLSPEISIEKIQSLGRFLSNFYILNSQQGEIIKYPLSSIQAETINGKSWLSQPEEGLKTAQSMAIDGAIYVLNSQGTITEYFQGKEVRQIPLKLNQQLSGNNKLFVESDFKHLYISDPENRRLIVLNRKGEIINQYVNKEFNRLSDFWVTGNEKEIYFLCEKKVFKLKL